MLADDLRARGEVQHHAHVRRLRDRVVARELQLGAQAGADVAERAHVVRDEAGEQLGDQSRVGVVRAGLRIRERRVLERQRHARAAVDLRIVLRLVRLAHAVERAADRHHGRAIGVSGRGQGEEGERDVAHADDDTIAARVCTCDQVQVGESAHSPVTPESQNEVMHWFDCVQVAPFGFSAVHVLVPESQYAPTSLHRLVHG